MKQKIQDVLAALAVIAALLLCVVLLGNAVWIYMFHPDWAPHSVSTYKLNAIECRCVGTKQRPAGGR